MRERKYNCAHRLAPESCAIHENSSAKSSMHIRTKENNLLGTSSFAIVLLIFRPLALKCLLSLSLPSQLNRQNNIEEKGVVSLRQNNKEKKFYAKVATL